MAKKQFTLCKSTDIPQGTKKIIVVDGKSIGLFNVNGEIYALHNRCPHEGAELCRGPVTGTALPTDDFEYNYGMDGELIRCAWHGWEFEIASGKCLIDDRVRAKKYKVTIEQEDRVVIHI